MRQSRLETKLRQLGLLLLQFSFMLLLVDHMRIACDLMTIIVIFCREYTSYEELTADYGSGALHPGDLKPALAKALNAILQPVRDHFASDERAKKLLAQVVPCESRA